MTQYILYSFNNSQLLVVFLLHSCHTQVIQLVRRCTCFLLFRQTHEFNSSFIFVIGCGSMCTMIREGSHYLCFQGINWLVRSPPLFSILFIAPESTRNKRCRKNLYSFPHSCSLSKWHQTFLVQDQSYVHVKVIIKLLWCSLTTLASWFKFRRIPFHPD